VADETVAVGDVAPGSTLKDHKETEVALSDLRGKKVVLYIGEILAALEEFQVTPD
jgi:peroxiredoxin